MECPKQDFEVPPTTAYVASDSSCRYLCFTLDGASRAYGIAQWFATITNK